MKFGPVPLTQAEGAVLAHSAEARGANGAAFRISKGTILTRTHLNGLQGAGLTEVTVARLEPGDVPEDAAATELARALLNGAEGLEATRAANALPEGYRRR